MSHDVKEHCECVAEHRPPYLELEHHHVWPQEFGGPTVPENMVWICNTTHSNVHEILRAMLKDRTRPLTYREVQASEPRPVSRFAYDLALRGWSAITTGRVAA